MGKNHLRNTVKRERSLKQPRKEYADRTQAIIDYRKAKREALRLPHTEVMLNGICVAQLQYDPQRGTVLAPLVHHPRCACPKPTASPDTQENPTCP